MHVGARGQFVVWAGGWAVVGRVFAARQAALVKEGARGRCVDVVSDPCRTMAGLMQIRD